MVFFLGFAFSLNFILTKNEKSFYEECPQGHRFHPECLKLLSADTSKCPHCGATIPENHEISKRPKLERVLVQTDSQTFRRKSDIPYFKLPPEETDILLAIVKFLKSSETVVLRSNYSLSRLIETNNWKTIAQMVKSRTLPTIVEGVTPFHYAILKKRLALAEFFLRLGCDPSIGNQEMSPQKHNGSGFFT